MKQSITDEEAYKRYLKVCKLNKVKAYDKETFITALDIAKNEEKLN